MSEGEYLTEQEVARRTTLSPRTLQRLRLRNDGGPAFSRVGRRVLYRWADVEAWIRAQAGATAA